MVHFIIMRRSLFSFFSSHKRYVTYVWEWNTFATKHIRFILPVTLPEYFSLVSIDAEKRLSPGYFILCRKFDKSNSCQLISRPSWMDFLHCCYLLRNLCSANICMHWNPFSLENKLYNRQYNLLPLGLIFLTLFHKLYKLWLELRTSRLSWQPKREKYI